MEYDVFLSHNTSDKPSVEILARRLLAAGIRPWLDSWNLTPGRPWQEKLEEALDACETCAVFLGPSGIGPWHNQEMQVALDRRVRDRTRLYRVIPVLLPGAASADPNELPRFLSRMSWVDFRTGLDDPFAFHRLLSGIKGTPPGPVESAPSTAPGHSSMLTPLKLMRLRAELSRLQSQYDAYSRRLAALDTDIGRALDSLSKQILEERRLDLASERESVAAELQRFEKLLTSQ